MQVPTFTKPQPPPRLPDGRLDIYFSFWSWKMLKHCPYQYRLTVLEQLRPAFREKGNAIQGGVPDKMVEDFFALPTEKRRELTLQWFYDQFEHYWSLWQDQKDGNVTWMSSTEEEEYIRLTAGDRPLPVAHRPRFKGKFSQKLKKAETLEHIQSLVQMLAERSMVDLNVETQLSFRTTVEETAEYRLTVGGRIDLVFEVTPGIFDIWDLKGVKKADYNDDDQLGVYKLGLQGKGKQIRNCGFLNMKQKMFDLKEINDVFLKDLKERMITVFKNTLGRGVYMPIYNLRTCDYCDVKGSCATYKENHESSHLISQMLPGGKILI